VKSRRLGTAKNLLGLINVLRKKNKKVLFQAFKKLEPVKSLLGLINVLRKKNQEGFISGFQKKIRNCQKPSWFDKRPAKK
jgi:hypothetical protein